MATIIEENALPGVNHSLISINGAGDTSNLGFAREFSVNVGETIHFSCHGSGVVLDVYRVGWYNGDRYRKITSLVNVATAQPNPTVITNTNGATTCTNWSTTASWDVPSDATSGLYVALLRNQAQNNASYIPFVIRNDDLEVDIIVKTSDTTWALAYNFYGTPASPLTGKSLYGSGGPLGESTTRAHAGSYHRPIVTRQGVAQTYWLNSEAPLIHWIERNGYKVKYVSSKDVDADANVLSKSKVLISSGHDEYWTDNMRDAFETYRDNGKHILFMSANEVFWRTRFNEDRTIMYCYKDTMSGPGSHVGGTPLDPVTWTGTWKDTRWSGRKPENTLTGTDFRMNGVNDKTAVLTSSSHYANHPVWRNSALKNNDQFLVGAIGFEGDRMLPTQPTENCRILAAHTVNINGAYANDNGQDYTGNGNLVWGIVSQGYSSGAIVIGFGTCQWSWFLDNVHDRMITSENVAVQQFQMNVLRDLGVDPESKQVNLVVSGRVSLLNYGLPVLDEQHSVYLGDGTRLAPYKMINGELVDTHIAI